MLTVERVATPAGLEALAPAWGALLARDPHRHPFVSYEWTRTWWQHFGGGAELWLLAVKDGPEVAGIAPMMLKRTRFRRLPVRMLSFMKNRHVSRADVIAPERRDEVAAALARYWRAQAGRWDVLELRNLPRRSGTAGLLIRALADAGLGAFGPVLAGCIFYIPVQDSYEDYVRRQSKKFRKGVANARNRLARAGDVRVIVEREPARMRAAFERLFRLETVSRKQAGGTALLDACEKSFCAVAAEAFAGGYGCDVRFLQLDGQDIAGLFTLRYDRALYLMITYFDETRSYLNPGRNLIENMFADWWNQAEIDRIDFNAGSDYIMSWTKAAQEFESVWAFNSRPYSRLAAAANRLSWALRGRTEG